MGTSVRDIQWVSGAIVRVWHKGMVLRSDYPQEGDSVAITSIRPRRDQLKSAGIRFLALWVHDPLPGWGVNRLSPRHHALRCCRKPSVASATGDAGHGGLRGLAGGSVDVVRTATL